MNTPQFNVSYVNPDGTLKPTGVVFQEMAQAIATLQATVEAQADTIADHETRIAALEGP